MADWRVNETFDLLDLNKVEMLTLKETLHRALDYADPSSDHRSAVRGLLDTVTEALDKKGT